MGFPYIYIYCISISRVFSCFLTFFTRFWILSFFCVVSPGKSLFFDVFCRVDPISQIGPFFDFFKIGRIQRDGIWVLSIFRFLAFFYFFWVVLLFLDRLSFLSFFYRFLVFSFLVECGISRATFFWILKK